MDHAGAVIGPLAATVFLLVAPGRYRALFLLTAIPGAIAVVLVWRVRDANPDQPRTMPADFEVSLVQTDAQGVPAAEVRLPRAFFAYAGVVAIFTLGNSTTRSCSSA